MGQCPVRICAQSCVPSPSPSSTRPRWPRWGAAPHAKLQRYRDGEKLFEAGDRDFKFFVVKSGEVEIVDESGETPKTIAILGPGEFTGDVAQLTGSPSLVSAVARGDCEVYEVSPEALRQILNQSPDLGDIILQAFIARRQLLRESADFTGLRVIGSRYSQDTFRDPRLPGQEPGRRSPGWTWRPTRRWSNCSGGSA